MLFGIGAGFSGMRNAEKAADELGMGIAPALLVTHYYDVWFVINICNLSATFSHLLAICTCISALLMKKGREGKSRIQYAATVTPISMPPSSGQSGKVKTAAGAI